MIELIVGTYGVLCWLLFKKFKLIPITTYTICTAILGGFVILALLFISLSLFHPISHEGRTYTPVVQIVSNVRGTVIEVPVVANVPLKMGDVLFRIDPRPYQIEVDRLMAALAVKNVKFAQLSEQLAAAEAATKEARANLLVAESQFDRQARESAESANALVQQVQKRLDLAQSYLSRTQKLGNAVSAQDLENAQTRVLTLQEEYKQAVSAEKIAKEKLQSGSGSLEAVRQDIAQLESAERQIRLQLNTESDGVTPEVREVMAQLDQARWNLEQTVVRAPSDGYVPQKLLRPGMMSTAFAAKPLMMFIVNEKPTLIATYQQKAISGIKPGMRGEAIFKAYPGRVFPVTVRQVMTAIREGEIDASGQLASVNLDHSHGGSEIPIVFDYDEDVSGLNLPVGSQASVAIYTDRVHALSIVRKILMRMKSWENFVF